MTSLPLRLLLPLLALGGGLVTSYVEPLGVLWVLLFLAWLLLGERYVPQLLWWLGGLIFSVLLAAHLLPGFSVTTVWEPHQLAHDSPPYALRLAWDKWLLGLCLLVWWLGRPRAPTLSPQLALSAAALTLVAVPLFALALGLVGWQPKWPTALWQWLLINLFVSVLAEELLFRGWLQSLLVERLGAAIGIALTALLFGAAHLPFGVAFALLAGISGLGYGLAFHYSGRLWPAVLLHGCVNLLHLLLLSYPLRMA